MTRNRKLEMNYFKLRSKRKRLYRMEIATNFINTVIEVTI